MIESVMERVKKSLMPAQMAFHKPQNIIIKNYTSLPLILSNIEKLFIIFLLLHPMENLTVFTSPSSNISPKTKTILSSK